MRGCCYILFNSISGQISGKIQIFTNFFAWLYARAGVICRSAYMNNPNELLNHLCISLASKIEFMSLQMCISERKLSETSQCVIHMTGYKTCWKLDINQQTSFLNTLSSAPGLAASWNITYVPNVACHASTPHPDMYCLTSL